MCCMRWIGAKGHTFGVLLAVQALGDTMSENIILTPLNGQRMGTLTRLDLYMKRAVTTYMPMVSIQGMVRKQHLQQSRIV